MIWNQGPVIGGKAVAGFSLLVEKPLLVSRYSFMVKKRLLVFRYSFFVEKLV